MGSENPSDKDFPMVQLEFANAENARLSQENALLRQKLECLIAQKHSSDSIHIEAKLHAFKMEEERDRMYEKLEKIKRKYNQLHEAYLQKVKRCKALEDVFNQQKTLNGLVLKSAADHPRKDGEAAASRGPSKNAERQTVHELEAQLKKLQTALDEAYDVVDELEFELESVDFLEMENQRLRNELEAHRKKDQLKLREVSDAVEATEIAGSSCDELPEYRPREAGMPSRYQLDSKASSLADSIVGELDPATIERSVLTESLIKMAESESKCLRRELLRSRLQKRNSLASVRPTSSDA